ncbi:hypothetical protein [Lentibacillus sediminis]|uniref:hypothetical protein n=1 Tax=Lentibacillus sediminis TaxID=1940529 RepID=UPI000C1B8161|nr:hypothetical protein [Lentibacillus sediminis]
MSRNEMHRKTHRKKRKWLLGAAVLIVFFGSSLNVVFADQNIQSLLTNWFDQKKTESIGEIEEAVDAEQQKQTQRLQEALRPEIEKLNEQLNAFTDQEKAKSIQAIQGHADQLIANIELDGTEEKENVAAEFKQIIQEAKDKMDHVRATLETNEEASETEQPENE